MKLADDATHNLSLISRKSAEMYGMDGSDENVLATLQKNFRGNKRQRGVDVRKGPTKKKKAQRKSDEWKEEAEGDGYQLEKHQVAGNTRPTASNKRYFYNSSHRPTAMPCDCSYYFKIFHFN